MNKKLILKIVVNLAILALAIAAIYPLIFMFLNSFKTLKEYSGNIFSIPVFLTIQNYISAFTDKNFIPAFLNSAFNSVISTTVVIFAGFVAGFFLVRFRFRGKKLVYMLFFLGLLIPIPALMVPIFLQFKDVGLYNMRLSLLLPYIAFNLSLAVFLFESYIRSLPSELDESAAIDGASINIIMYKIIMPICTPIIATVAVLTFLATWNELLFALTLTRGEKYMTLPLWLSHFKGQRSIDYPKMITGMVLTSLPVLILYIRFNKRIMTGLAAGAIKG